MARAYGTTSTSIWDDDDDFTSLPSSAQRTYWMLYTQPDISPCGVLAITLKRWSRKASDTTAETIADDIAMLSTKGFVVVDDGTEELLIRTFVKHDGGYKVPNRLRSILRNAVVIQSKTLLQVVASELDKLGVEHDLLVNPSRNPSERHAERVSPGIGVVVTREVTSEQPVNLEPGTGGGKASASRAVAPPPVCSKHPDGTETPCRACATARKKREQWDSEKRIAANEFAAYLKTQPECEHGISGGNIDRPNIGTPSCAQCRRLRKAAS